MLKDLADAEYGSKHQRFGRKMPRIERIERRASFYDLAIEIADEHPLHATIIILATWNMGRFRFMVSNSQNLINLKSALEHCKPLFEKIKDKDFKNVNFDDIKEVTVEIYNTLSRVKGVEYTGASKIMHLFNKNLFVMWDSYIREKYHCNKDAEGYLIFQKKMQNRFKHIEWNYSHKTLAKAIDEYNYVTITLPELKKRRKKLKSSRKAHAKVQGEDEEKE